VVSTEQNTMYAWQNESIVTGKGGGGGGGAEIQAKKNERLIHTPRRREYKRSSIEYGGGNKRVSTSLFERNSKKGGNGLTGKEIRKRGQVSFTCLGGGIGEWRVVLLRRTC